MLLCLFVQSRCCVSILWFSKVVVFVCLSTMLCRFVLVCQCCCDGLFKQCICCSFGLVFQCCRDCLFKQYFVLVWGSLVWLVVCACFHNVCL